jgi:Xaa-Pro aminopeptidase
MTAKERFAALRAQMRKEKLAAYLVPSTDPHQSEYVPERWKRREWLSGFTGSAGDVLATMNAAGLWTDSRYYLQAEQELDASVIRLFRTGDSETPTIERFLTRTLKRGQTLGVDPHLVSQARAEQLEQQLAPFDIAVRYPARNLVDAVWPDPPEPPGEPVMRHPDRFAGQTAEQKLTALREELQRLDAEYIVLTALDQIAWLFNIRGADVEYNPVVIAYAVIGRELTMLFTAEEKYPEWLQHWLRGFARLLPYEEVGLALRTLGQKKRRVLIDPDGVDRWVVQQLRGARLMRAPSVVAALKSLWCACCTGSRSTSARRS